MFSRVFSLSLSRVTISNFKTTARPSIGWAGITSKNIKVFNFKLEDLKWGVIC